MNGILNILKPTGMTSHDVVSRVRKILNMKKVGHAGTLDPNVAGVMAICVGKGTKISDYLMSGDKEYICELILGQKTDTQDSYGKIVDEKYNFSVSVEEIHDILKDFEGEQLQVPPMYSAVKLNGKKLYEYARQNIEVNKPGKLIDIKKIEFIKFENNRVLMRVKCSKGTYMRTLCNDIGEKLGTFGHMGILVRTEAKGLHIENSVTLDELEYLFAFNKLNECLISIDEMYPLEKIIVDERYYDRLAAGNEVFAEADVCNGSEFYVYCRNKLVGIGKKIGNNSVKIEKMLI
ncbi:MULTISPECIES: tRNA pseudouridine(55) synthase TruB [unclassified Sedimentibacter]|uniref:tRNA pseudouridine(55) synthase TruB n=1 Tax=unclassified Sedimentibacter TaxID=2649220 RepID=UPI0027DEDB21|nr:tRNA pseudouridine(55) synthase TruB [Sedimentibacter sp. MB35-C1]WMJ76147.1 tRNA pseudouridine(55) synthase TruB [Sedimentibacter sp. MB35-C1]